MFICIPTLRDTFRLGYPWQAWIMHEYRNSKFLGSLPENMVVDFYKVHLGTRYGQEIFEKWTKVEFPADTEITPTRIYIRGTSRQFDSVTFSMKFKTINPVTNRPKTFKGKCWVKLGDFNNIYYDVMGANGDPLADTRKKFDPRNQGET